MVEALPAKLMTARCFPPPRISFVLALKSGLLVRWKSKIGLCQVPSSNQPYNIRFKVMLHGTIRNNDFWRNTALQHCCNIDSNGCNIVPALQCCVAQKIVVANRLV